MHIPSPTDPRTGSEDCPVPRRPDAFKVGVMPNLSSIQNSDQVRAFPIGRECTITACLSSMSLKGKLTGTFLPDRLS